MNGLLFISNVLMRMVAMTLLVVVIGISLMRATHTHSHERDCLENDSRHSDTEHPDGMPDCDVCEFYAHFAPKEAGANLSFTFTVPTRLVETRSGQPTWKVPCKELCNQYVNRGPPLGSHLI